ncbi:hypothetical protein GQ53DRAFT_881388 [Thozetella sp. PMI_491]|nr:hypothetical protein GQ53DRAFT_881388 [Thozetella sp. PMI_491]
MVFAPPEPVDVWQHKKGIQSKFRENTKASASTPKPAQSSENLVSEAPPAVDKEPPVVNTAPSVVDEEALRPASSTKPVKQHRKTAKMGTIKENVWMSKTVDGQDRSHIPPMSMQMFRLRIAQIVLAVIFLILSAFAAYTLNMSNWCILSGWDAVEALTNIFWLASWATFASYASAINLPGAGRAVGRRQAPPGPAGGPATQATTTPTGLGPTAAGGLASNSASAVLAAEIAIAVDAAIGAVIWVLFCITLLMTVTSILRHRNGSKVSKGKEPETEMSGAA